MRGLQMTVDFQHDSQMWAGLLERELVPWFRRFSEGIATAIDVGASQGMYTLYFLARTSARKVVAFEPVPENVARLRRNLQWNGLENSPRVQIVEKFVSDHEDEQQTTLDSLSASIALPCLVKIDAEGGEAGILNGSHNLLERNGIRWIVEAHSKQSQEECEQIFKARGYSVSIVPKAWWRTVVPELRPIDVNQWLVATREAV